MKGSNNAYAPHESLELHELMRSEIICAKKLQMNIPMVDDPQLKQFMEDSLNTKKSTLSDLQKMVHGSDNKHLQ